MIYDKLRTLPKVIQIDIYNTGDVSLLSDEGKPISELELLWEKLDEEFNARFNRTEKNKIFNLAKEIEFQSNRWTIIKSACEALTFDRSQEMIALLHGEGYKFSEDNYKEDLDRAIRESDAILTKIKILSNQLPKVPEGNNLHTSIIEVMACYSAVLGVGFDFNTCSVEAFHGYESQAKAKIKSIESSSRKK
jgi:hypothetical protein